MIPNSTSIPSYVPKTLPSFAQPDPLTQGGGYGAPPQLGQQVFPQGTPYFGQTLGQSGATQQPTSVPTHGPLKFGFEPCSTAACCCILPAAVAGGGILWALKSVIGKVFGAIKGIVGGIGNIATKGASAAGEAAIKA
ncbi:MAG TPA: hypothetical protein V6C52_06150 [Coleofasciculaceae cyanobacterium]